MINSNFELRKSGLNKIGKTLLEMGIITSADVDSILVEQAKTGLRFGDAAKKLGLISEDELQQILSIQFEYPHLTAENLRYGKNLVTINKPFEKDAEKYRALRSQLFFRWFNEGYKSLSIVGVTRNVGSDDVISNLGIAFAQLGKRTLIIDANLREPSIHQIFDLDNTSGLSDVIAGRSELSDVLSPLNGFSNISILTSGPQPPNPQELLSRRNFIELIKSVEADYDVVLVNTTPFDQALDYQIVSYVTKGSILLARVNESNLNDLKEMKHQLEAVGVSVVGVVLNKSN